MRLYGVLATTSVLLILGCQGGAAPTASPDLGGPPEQSGATVDQPLVIGTAEGSQSGVFGLYQLTVGTDGSGQLAGSVTPAVRGVAARGDNYAIDATGFFTASPCSDCLRVVGLRQDVDGNVVANLELTHPFALPPQPEPLSSRLDLHAFDVMGYIITDGGGGSPLTFSDGADVAPPVLLNADGYSDLYDAVLEQYLPSPNVSDHPYRVFFRDDTVGNFAVGNPNGFADLRDPQGHNVIAMGEVDAIDYTFDIPDGGQISVGLAIGASWGQGAKGAGTALGQRLNPVFFAYEFHHKAPWMVTAQIANNNLEEGNLTSNAEVWVRLRDWQIGAVVDPAFDVLTTPVDQIRAASEVQDLTIEIPGLLSSPIVLDPSTPGVGTGLFDDAIWTTLITNANNAPAGTYYAWVRARDERVPLTAAGLDRSLTPFTVANFHTGALVAVEVVAVSNTPPVPDLVITSEGCACADVTYDASGSTDAETPLANLLFEFDFDLPSGDPLNFTADTPQSTTPTGLQSFCAVTDTFGAVRVTDGSGVSAIAVLAFQVNPGLLPEPAVTVVAAGAMTPPAVFPSNTGIGTPHFIDVNGSHVYVAFAQQQDPIWRMLLYVSSDGGQTFTPGAVLDRTFPGVSSYFWGHTKLRAGSDGAVYMDTQQARPDFSNTQLDLWVSTGFGTNPWTSVHTQIGGQKYAVGGAVDPTNPANVIYTYGNGNVNVLRSTNGPAGPWTVASAGGFFNSNHGMSVFFAPNNRVYLLGYGYTPFPVGAGNYGGWLARSDNNGANFGYQKAFDMGVGSSPFSTGRGMAWRGDPTGSTAATVVHQTGGQPIKLFSTTDAGVTWAPVNMSVDGGAASNGYSGAAFDPDGNIVVYWRSTGSQMQAVVSSDLGVSFGAPVSVGPASAIAGYVTPDPSSCDFYALYQETGSGGAIRVQKF